MTHVQDFFRKSLSKATFERKLSDVSLPLSSCLLLKELLGRAADGSVVMNAVDERSSVPLLTSYQSTSHVLTVRRPGVNIMTDFDIIFAS